MIFINSNLCSLCMQSDHSTYHLCINHVDIDVNLNEGILVHINMGVSLCRCKPLFQFDRNIFRFRKTMKLFTICRQNLLIKVPNKELKAHSISTNTLFEENICTLVAGPSGRVCFERHWQLFLFLKDGLRDIISFQAYICSISSLPMRN